MTGNSRDLEKKFVREVEGLWLTAPNTSFEELVKALRKIRKKYLAEANGNAKTSIEVERRISEYALEFALSHGLQLSVCRRKFNECASLGFTDTFREAHFRLLYAESMAKRGHGRAAFKMIREAVALLDLSLNGKKPKSAQEQHYRQWADRITSNLE